MRSVSPPAPGCPRRPLQTVQPTAAPKVSHTPLVPLPLLVQSCPFGADDDVESLREFGDDAAARSGTGRRRPQPRFQDESS